MRESSTHRSREVVPLRPGDSEVKASAASGAVEKGSPTEDTAITVRNCVVVTVPCGDSFVRSFLGQPQTVSHWQSLMPTQQDGVAVEQQGVTSLMAAVACASMAAQSQGTTYTACIMTAMATIHHNELASRALTKRNSCGP